MLFQSVAMCKIDFIIISLESQFSYIFFMHFTQTAMVSIRCIVTFQFNILPIFIRSASQLRLVSTGITN